MKKVRISDDALADLDEGYAFHELREPTLGDYFFSCIRADIDGLKISGGTHRIVVGDLHRHLSRVFPYGIFYFYEERVVTVVAIIDLRREPEWIYEKLQMLKSEPDGYTTRE